MWLKRPPLTQRGWRFLLTVFIGITEGYLTGFLRHLTGRNSLTDMHGQAARWRPGESFT